MTFCSIPCGRHRKTRPYMDTDLCPQTIKKKTDVIDVKFSLISQVKWHPSSNKDPGDIAISCSLTSLIDLALNHNILSKTVLDQSSVLNVHWKD